MTVNEAPTMLSVEEIEARILDVHPHVERVREQVGRVIVGQKSMIDRLLIGLFSKGHVLLEGVPGLAKTTAVRALSDSLALDYSRIQFTPDLLPADIVGTQVYEPKSATFSTRKGPVFANIVLADEINRAPPKVQSALLEAMQERQVTIGDETYPLDDPFLVLATQNPIEQEGTYALPEAQVDRFMMKLRVDYPDLDDELAILDRASLPPPDLERVADREVLGKVAVCVQQVKVTEPLRRYVVDLVRATRDPGSVAGDLKGTIAFGASPRASIALMAAARAHAFLVGRGYTLPEDVKAMAHDVLRHRVLPTYEAEAEGLDPDTIIDRLLETVDQR